MRLTQLPTTLLKLDDRVELGEAKRHASGDKRRLDFLVGRPRRNADYERLPCLVVYALPVESRPAMRVREVQEDEGSPATVLGESVCISAQGWG